MLKVDETGSSLSPTNSNRLNRIITAVALGFALAYAVGLLLLFRRHLWIVDAHGKPLVTDFLEVWVAGRTALSGVAASVYDPNLHHAAQVAAVGHQFEGFLGWHYPPTFLFAAAMLARLPYVAAFFVWIVATMLVYAGTIAAIARSRVAILFSLAAPTAFANMVPGQNGFLTAALIGAALLTLEGRPILSGVFLGILTYKPQFGLLFPLALMAGGHWRALASAAVAATLLSAAAFLVFGSASYQGFLHFLPSMSHAVLVEGRAGWWKLQSVYGLARWLGVSNAAAWPIQVVVMLTLGSAVTWMWRQSGPFALKAAALSAAVPFMTPYLYMYDLPMLMLPLAFLYRDAHFDRTEMAGVLMANVAIAAFVVFKMSVGPFAALIVCILVARRVVLRSAGRHNVDSHADIGQIALATSL